MLGTTRDFTLLTSKDGFSYNGIKEIAEVMNEKHLDIDCTCNDILILFNDETGCLCLYYKDNEYILSDWSITQLCSMFHVPKTYIENCYRNGLMDLVVKNFNDWLALNADKKLRLITYYNRVDGIVSQMYMRISHLDVLETMEDSLQNKLSNLKIVNKQVDSNYMHLRMIEAEPFHIDRTGSPLFVGYYIQNSEVGRSRLIFDTFIYRQVCTNGLCVPQAVTKFDKRHIGTGNFNLSELKEYIDKSTSNGVQAQIINDLKNSEYAIIHEETAKDILKKLSLTNKNIAIPASVNQFINLYSFINSLTAYARTLPIDSRLTLETQAGALLREYVA